MCEHAQAVYGAYVDTSFALNRAARVESRAANWKRKEGFTFVTSTVLHRFVIATNWKPLERNTLKGFVDLTLPSGLIIHGCSLHRKNESRWMG